MPLAIWSEDLRVGVYEIDRQHRGLMDCLNELDDLLVAGRPQAAFGPVFDRLLRDTENHFRYEEQCMRECDYPRLEAHMREHRDLMDKVKVLQEAFWDGRVLFSRSVVDFLHRWLVIHMEDSDKRFAEYLRNTGRTAA